MRRIAVVLGIVGAVIAGAMAGPATTAVAVGPVVRDDAYTFLVGLEARVPSPGILANDDPVDSLPGLRIVSPLKHGSISGTGTVGRGGFVYTPDNWTNPLDDSFTYCLFDGGDCVTNVATVRITFERPVPADDVFSTPQDTALTVMRPGPVANDSSSAYAWAALTKPAHGVLTSPPAAGGFVYTPAAGFRGTDSFEYCMSAVQGSPTDCVSETATVSIRVGEPAVSRIAGTDRYDGAARVAQAEFPSPAVGTPVFVASGENFPDALGAGPAAVKRGAALLLTRAGELPASTATEIARLKPGVVTVVGGPSSVSDAVLASIRTIVPSATVTRVGGADRYAVSRALTVSVFGTADHSFVATGATFPDALSAGAAAGAVAQPVTLLDGRAGAVDRPTLDAFRAMNVSAITLVGGEASISSGVQSSLRPIGPVARLAGSDRYGTSVTINASRFGSATTAFIATGTNYPDALVGSVIAGASKSPLYVVPGTCVPQAVLTDISRVGATRIVLLGGEASLTRDVENLVPCA
ncbi:cell wall-binding repeat-containing protein [Herbiconiux moechotypicola]|uniref:Cell wall-binding repeat-containing protein n=1 Tax=Herbiconiux moechotypicola TaxID=637393 RepID=A0ABN3DZH4_9MICO|nr:cell wall-binding repeat-containing protein [Herbiconiux moechotypicola]MCS5731155.1 cell wall-binding repeat-containing protein [Herbiconiux moechotypicola]